jgi:hypothetical protein
VFSPASHESAAHYSRPRGTTRGGEAGGLGEGAAENDSPPLSGGDSRRSKRLAGNADGGPLLAAHVLAFPPLPALLAFLNATSLMSSVGLRHFITP